MQRAVSTVCFQPYSLDRALQGARAAGFDDVEICAIQPFCAHIDPDRRPAGVIDETRALLDRYKLRCVGISGHDQLQRQEGRGRLERLLEVCSGIEAPFLLGFTGDVATQEERDAFIDNARYVADASELAAVHFCLENDSQLMPTGRAAAGLLPELSRRAVGLNFDMANGVFLEGADPLEDLEFALPYLEYVHIKDKRGGQGVYDFPPLGQGELPLQRALARLARTGFDGPVTLEIEYHGPGTWPPWSTCVDDCRRSRLHWERLIHDGG